MGERVLGRIKEVDVRCIWQDESRDFTPWLARKEHLKQLGEALGVDLSLLEQEGEVGSFAVDIVAQNDNGVIVIENQLERTNHAHLGQLLTYAAGRDAKILVWVTPEFRDEHRAALDWLNRWTARDIEIYGVEVRVIQIEDSLPAVEFRPVAAPNEFSSQAKATGANSQNDGYKQFFQPVVEGLRELGLTNRRSARAQPSQSFAFGAESIAGVTIQYILRVWSDGSLGVKLHLADGKGQSGDRLAIFDELQKDMKAIEEEIGVELTWDRYEDWSYSQVQAWRSGTIDESPDQVREYQEWMVNLFPKLAATMSTRLSSISRIIESEETESAEGSASSE